MINSSVPYQQQLEMDDNPPSFFHKLITCTLFTSDYRSLPEVQPVQISNVPIEEEPREQVESELLEEKESIISQLQLELASVRQELSKLKLQNVQKNYPGHTKSNSQGLASTSTSSSINGAVVLIGDGAAPPPPMGAPPPPPALSIPGAPPSLPPLPPGAPPGAPGAPGAFRTLGRTRAPSIRLTNGTRLPVPKAKVKQLFWKPVVMRTKGTIFEKMELKDLDFDNIEQEFSIRSSSKNADPSSSSSSSPSRRGRGRSSIYSTIKSSSAIMGRKQSCLDSKQARTAGIVISMFKRKKKMPSDVVSALNNLSFDIFDPSDIDSLLKCIPSKTDFQKLSSHSITLCPVDDFVFKLGEIEYVAFRLEILKFSHETAQLAELKDHCINVTNSCKMLQADENFSNLLSEIWTLGKFLNSRKSSRSTCIAFNITDYLSKIDNKVLGWLKTSECSKNFVNSCSEPLQKVSNIPPKWCAAQYSLYSSVIRHFQDQMKRHLTPGSSAYKIVDDLLKKSKLYLTECKITDMNAQCDAIVDFLGASESCDEVFEILSKFCGQLVQ